MGYATASTILEYIHANPDMKEVIRFAPPITGNIQSAMCANRVISVTHSAKIRKQPGNLSSSCSPPIRLWNEPDSSLCQPSVNP